MPATFRPADVLILNKYGYFSKYRIYGQELAAATAVSLTNIIANTQDPRARPFSAAYRVATPAITHSIPVDLAPERAVILERFDWGATDAPDAVYYELWNWGKAIPPYAMPGFPPMTQEQEGFLCAGPVGNSDVDNRSMYVAAADNIELRLWNCTLDTGAEVVWYEFTIWYYIYRKSFLDYLLATSDAYLFKEVTNAVEALQESLAEKGPPGRR